MRHSSIDNAKARNAELAQIHIGVAALGWDEDHYRHVLQAKTGKASAADLDSTGRKRFLEHLRQCGWQQAKKPFSQADKIKWLWRKLKEAGALVDPSEAALMAFVGRTTGVEVSDLRFLPVRDASKVTEGLKAWLNRSTTHQPKRGTR